MRIECFKGFLVTPDGEFYNSKNGRKLTPFVGSDGYWQVVRRNEEGKPFHIRCHVALANLFIPNPNGYGYVNHIDSNKLNNSLDNLEWCTNSYNVKHGWDSGNRIHKNNTKVKATDITTGEEFIFPSIRELGRTLNVDRHKVARILKGEFKNHYNYNFDYI